MASHCWFSASSCGKEQVSQWQWGLHCCLGSTHPTPPLPAHPQVSAASCGTQELILKLASILPGRSKVHENGRWCRALSASYQERSNKNQLNKIAILVRWNRKRNVPSDAEPHALDLQWMEPARFFPMAHCADPICGDLPLLRIFLRGSSSTPEGCWGENFWLHCWTRATICRWIGSCLWTPLLQPAARWPWGHGTLQRHPKSRWERNNRSQLDLFDRRGSCGLSSPGSASYLSKQLHRKEAEPGLLSVHFPILNFAHCLQSCNGLKKGLCISASCQADSCSGMFALGLFLCLAVEMVAVQVQRGV